MGAFLLKGAWCGMKLRVLSLLLATFLIVSGAISALLSVRVSLQAQSSSETLRVETQLVQVPVIVTDKQGRLVEGLTKEDFAVKEDGKLQRIAVFEPVKHQSVPQIKLPVPEGVFTNRVVQQGPARLTIIAIDAVSTAVTEKEQARKTILDFISNNISVDQPVALIMLGEHKIKVLHDFTTDPRVLIAALKNISGGHEAATGIAQDNAIVQTQASPLISGNQAMFNQMAAAETDTIQTAFQSFFIGQRRSMVSHTLDAFNEIAQAFVGIPGRKSLIWITNGESISTGDLDIAASLDPAQTMNSSTALPNPSGSRSRGSSVTITEAGPRVNEYFERSWRLLNESNIAVYPLDISNQSNPAFTDPSLRVRSALHRPVNNLDKLEQFAESTGGTVCYHSTELDDCFKKANEDAQDYYMLSYYADRTNTRQGWREIRVTVDKRDVKVRARTGYYRQRSNPGDKKAAYSEILNAIGSPLEFSSVPLEVKIDKISPIEDNATKKRISFLLFVPPTADFLSAKDHSMDLAFAAVAKLPNATPVGQFLTEAAGIVKPAAAADLSIHGFVMPAAIDLEPGNYEMKCVVRNNQNGRIGSVTVPLVVANGPQASK
jgi:VWFA-related protein